MRCQNDSYVASLVLRSRLKKSETHQKKASNIFHRLSNSQKLKLNDQVRIRNPRKIIQKESSIFNPIIGNINYSIIHIDKKKFPYIYSLDNIKKKFYSWHIEAL